MPKLFNMIAIVSSEVPNFITFVILIFFALVQIALCIGFSVLTGAPLNPNDPHYWLSAFNHLISVSMIGIVMFAWVSPLKKNFGKISEKLEKSRLKNLEIAHILRGHLGWQFEKWGLTSSERDVAMLSLKGLKIGEIAEYRNSREGTIKAHLNAIFRKADVSSRTELLATCLESFIDLGSAPEDEDTMTHPERSIIRNLAMPAN